MESFNIPCPFCETVLEIPREYLGESIDCPECEEKLRFALPSQLGMNEEEEEPAEEAVEEKSKNSKVNFKRKKRSFNRKSNSNDKTPPPQPSGASISDSTANGFEDCGDITFNIPQSRSYTLIGTEGVNLYLFKVNKREISKIKASMKNLRLSEIDHADKKTIYLNDIKKYELENNDGDPCIIITTKQKTKEYLYVPNSKLMMQIISALMLAYQGRLEQRTIKQSVARLNVKHYISMVLTPIVAIILCLPGIREEAMTESVRTTGRYGSVRAVFVLLASIGPPIVIPCALVVFIISLIRALRNKSKYGKKIVFYNKTK